MWDFDEPEVDDDDDGLDDTFEEDPLVADDPWAALNDPYDDAWHWM
jgi:hypothetical protein